MRKSNRAIGLLGAALLLLIAGCGGSSSGSELLLTTLEPAQGVVGGGTEVTLTGSGFSKGVQTVTFGWVNATDVVLLDDQTIRCKTPANAQGPCDVGIALYEGGIVMPGAFTYISPEPTITGVAPPKGSPGVATRIALAGSGFLFEPVTVTVGGLDCTNVVIASDGALTCNVPSTGTGLDLTVTVTTDGGTASLENAYSYIAPLIGTYVVAAFNGLNDGGTPAGQAVWGTVVSDGLGTFTSGSLWTNEGGITSGPVPPPPTPYQVYQDRTFTSGVAGNPELVGRLSADGSLGILGSVQPGVPTNLTIMGRVEEGVYDTTSLSGVYHVGAIIGVGPSRIGVWGTTDFDEAGGASSTLAWNDNGSVTPTFGPYPDTYTVAPDGHVTYTAVFAGTTLEGQILQGGNLVILAGGNADGGFPMLGVMVREGSGLTSGSFQGNFAFASMMEGNPAWDTNTGILDSTGGGDGEFLTLLGHDGDVTWTDWPEAPFPFTYDVATDGMLEAYVDGGDVPGGAMDTQGAVMAGGNFAFLAGSRVGGERPMLWFLLR